MSPVPPQGVQGNQHALSIKVSELLLILNLVLFPQITLGKPNCK